MATSGKTTAPISEPLEVEAQSTVGVPATRRSLWRFCVVLAVCTLCGAGVWQFPWSHHATAAAAQLYAYVPSIPLHHTVKRMSGERPGHLRNPVAPVAQFKDEGEDWWHIASPAESGAAGWRPRRKPPAATAPQFHHGKEPKRSRDEGREAGMSMEQSGEAGMRTLGRTQAHVIDRVGPYLICQDSQGVFYHDVRTGQNLDQAPGELQFLLQ